MSEAAAQITCPSTGIIDSLNMVRNATFVERSSAAKPISKKSVFEGEDNSSADSDSDDGGAQLGDGASAFKVNEEYARRFEHNKKREEQHRCEFN